MRISTLWEYTQGDSFLKEFVNSILEYVGWVLFLLHPGADSNAGQVDGEEQDGPHHAEPAGKKGGRKVEIISCR